MYLNRCMPWRCSTASKPITGATRSDQRRGRDATDRLAARPAKRFAELECPDFKTTPWVTGPALSGRRVAAVSSAGLVRRGEDPFRGRDPDYRTISSNTTPDDLLI